MGIYLNPQGVDFQEALISEIYVVGINYDKNDKRHTCKIEKITR